MTSSWVHRGFALVLLLALLGVAVSVPAMASGSSDMDAVMVELETKSHAKLAWLAGGLDSATTEGQALEYYNTAVTAIGLYSDQAKLELVAIAGVDPLLIVEAAELSIQIDELEVVHLQEALDMLEGWVPSTSSTTTTTIARSTTTTVVKSTTTTVVKSTTTTVGKSTTTTVGKSTTTTTASTTTTTQAGATTGGSDRETTTTTTISRTDGDVRTGGETPTATSTTSTTTTTLANAGAIVGGPGAGGSTPADFSASFDNEPVLAPDSFGEVLPYADDMMAYLGTDSPVTGMLVKYVPAGLPFTMARPVIGFLAIIEMIVGAFVSSFLRVGGPATAAGLYVLYSVWQYVRTRTGHLVAG